MSNLPSREAAQGDLKLFVPLWDQLTVLLTPEVVNRLHLLLYHRADGRLVDREAIDRNKANGIFYAALGAGAGFDVAFDAMLDAAIGDAI